MKIQRMKNLPWPTNPKTPEGWPKRIAIAMLSGLGIFLLSLPVSALLFLNHYEERYPKDPQNVLSALTGAVLLGLALAALGFTALLGVFFLLGLRGRVTTS
jgi:hypothetical protein